jgi:hypothetical protein
MTQIRWAPLLRGIGATIILLGTLIAYLDARNNIEDHGLKRQPVGLLGLPGRVATGNPAVTNAVAAEPEDDNEAVVREVLGNRFFEWMGLIGTAVFASSFYVEAFVRNPKGN